MQLSLMATLLGMVATRDACAPFLETCDESNNVKHVRLFLICRSTVGAATSLPSTSQQSKVQPQPHLQKVKHVFVACQLWAVDEDSGHVEANALTLLCRSQSLL